MSVYIYIYIICPIDRLNYIIDFSTLYILGTMRANNNTIVREIHFPIRVV